MPLWPLLVLAQFLRAIRCLLMPCRCRHTKAWGCSRILSRRHVLSRLEARPTFPRRRQAYLQRPGDHRADRAQPPET
ncbi:hypothetical protein X942_4724 [Burkholderia pseudomallei MSHR5596]|nr:hypothetical protein X942_4724 [Burkholderia pseudomallei MSHR5596]